MSTIHPTTSTEAENLENISAETEQKNFVPLVKQGVRAYNKREKKTSAGGKKAGDLSQETEALAREVASATAAEVLRQLHLENRTGEPFGISKGEKDMPKRHYEKVIINGKDRWVTGLTMQMLLDNYVQALVDEGLIERVGETPDVPLMKDYIRSFYNTFKKDQVQTTIINRERIIKNHILPRFGDKRIDEITSADCQAWINELNQIYARETILKIKNVINPVFEAAAEDMLIERNPLNSRFIKIGGKETIGHKAIPKEKMQEIRLEASILERKEKLMISLLAYTGMRFEEVLGIRWDDINDDWIRIQRAVIHPTRNQPLIKDTKTKTSNRIIPYFPELKKLIENYRTKGYILATEKDPTGETPLSYAEARRIFEKLRKRFDINEFSAHDFRDTCATEWREKGIPLDVIARLLGHAKTETTERKYVKYRTDLLTAVL